MAEVTGKLLVTVTVHDGTLEDAATALTRYRGKGWGREMTDLLNGGEFEVISAEVAGGTDQARDIARELLRHGSIPLDVQRRIAGDPALSWLRGDERRDLAGDDGG